MSPQNPRIDLEVHVDSKQANRAMGGIGGSLKSIALAAAAYIGVDAVRSFLKFTSSVEETKNLHKEVLGTMTADSEEWIQKFSQQNRRAASEIRKFVSDTAFSFDTLKFSKEVSNDLSKLTVQIGTDLASFRNALDKDVIDALNVALFGERERLRTYTGFISDQQVIEAIEDMGVAVKNLSGEELQRAKALGTLYIALQRANTAQGDLARTQGSLENEMKAARGGIITFFEAVSEKMLPSLAALVSSFGITGEAAKDVGEDVGSFAGDLVTVLNAYGLAFADFGKIISKSVTEDIGGASKSPTIKALEQSLDAVGDAWKFLTNQSKIYVDQTAEIAAANSSTSASVDDVKESYSEGELAIQRLIKALKGSTSAGKDETEQLKAQENVLKSLRGELEDQKRIKDDIAGIRKDEALLFAEEELEIEELKNRARKEGGKDLRDEVRSREEILKRLMKTTDVDDKRLEKAREYVRLSELEKDVLRLKQRELTVTEKLLENVLQIKHAKAMMMKLDIEALGVAKETELVESRRVENYKKMGFGMALSPEDAARAAAARSGGSSSGRTSTSRSSSTYGISKPAPKKAKKSRPSGSSKPFGGVGSWYAG